MSTSRWVATRGNAGSWLETPQVPELAWGPRKPGVLGHSLNQPVGAAPGGLHQLSLPEENPKQAPWSAPCPRVQDSPQDLGPSV